MALGRVGDAGLVGVDLEVDVRPAPRVAGREDAGERDAAVRVGDLDAAQVVLVLDALEYSEYPPSRSQCQT